MKKRFSERLGIVDSTPLLQLEGMNDALRNSIWNFVHSLFESEHDHWIPLARWVAELFRKVPVDELPYEDYECRRWVKDYYFQLPWNGVYDFAEFVVDNYQAILPYPTTRREELEGTFNVLFEREGSGYRFIAGVLAPISNPAETAEIAAAVDVTARTGLEGAQQHLHAALELLAKKPEPDYRNSVKESISAVESVAKLLGGEGGRGLAAALDQLGKRADLHGSLRAGFVKLYGYTSDADGIRHAILDEPSVGFDEAKYMLVSCSAFVNYLVSKAQSADLLPRGRCGRA